MKIERKIQEMKKKTLFLILLSYLIPIVVFFIVRFLSHLPLSPLITGFRIIVSPFLLLAPGTILGVIFLFLGFPPPHSPGEFGALFLPITLFGSYLFWMCLIWITYLLIRNKSNIKKKIGLFIISFISIFIVFISFNAFYVYINAVYGLFFLITALSIIILASFVSYKIYGRLVNEVK